MKKTHCIFIFLSFSLLKCMQNDLPIARLEWNPFNELHITLFSLQPDYAQQTFIRKNTKALQAIKDQNITFPLKFPLVTLDILVPTKIFAGKVLKTSTDNPQGDVTKFNELMITNPPSKKKGKHWYLVFTIEPNKDNFTLNAFKTMYTRVFFKNQREYPFLPHITLAEITKIYDKKAFLNAIEQINTLMKTLKPITTTEIKKCDLIFKPASAEHPRSTVMLEINNDQALNRFEEIKEWFNELMKPKQHLNFLQNSLTELFDTLSNLYIQLQMP